MEFDVPTVTSFFDNLSTSTKSTLSINDMEQQVNFINTATNDTLAMSPMLSLPVPTPTNIFTRDDTAAAYHDLLDIDKNVPIFQTTFERESTMTSPTISTYVSKPTVTSSNRFDSNKSPLRNPPNSIGYNVITSKASNQPKVRFLSKETDIADGFTESSIEITSEFRCFIFTIKFLHFSIDTLYSRSSN